MLRQGTNKCVWRANYVREESFYYKFFFRFNERVERQVTTLIMIMIMGLNNNLMEREQRKNIIKILCGIRVGHVRHFVI